MVAFLHGVVAGRAAGAMFDLGRVRADAAVLKRYCQSHQTIGLVSAAGQMPR
jgi:hypothetical protein